MHSEGGVRGIDGRRWSGVGLLAALCAAAALVVAVPAASASTNSHSEATSTCWKDVINDWLAHEPNVLGTYPIGCYTQALQHLDNYADIQGYSTAPDDIRRAMLAALHSNGAGGPGGPSSSSGPGGGPSSSGGGPSSGGGGHKSVITKLFNDVGPGNAQSVPLPLIVLGILAVVLLLSAIGTYAAKRIHGRRIAPARAPTPPRR